MPLGDSITDGYAIPGGYRTVLSEQLEASGVGFDFVGSLRNGPNTLRDKDHEGHSTWRINQLRMNIRHWVRTYRPDVVLLLVGTNDILWDQRRRTAPQRLGALVDHIHSVRPDAKILLSTIPPTNYVHLDSEVRKFNAAIVYVVRRRAAVNRPIWLVDGGGRLNAQDLADDKVHPNSTGYRKLARAWHEALRRIVLQS